jgi:hypothetical protein
MRRGEDRNWGDKYQVLNQLKLLHPTNTKEDYEINSVV